MVDLHVHTSASDGQYTPAQIIEKADEKKIKVIAITDHDTVSGVEQAVTRAKDFNITVVPGCEISINKSNCEFHLLGLGFTHYSSSLTSILENVVKNRELRTHLMVEKMQADGVDITYEEIISDYPDTVIGRPHLAAELEKKGIVKHRQQAFDKYLARGKPWYVEKIGTNLDEAILAINESGGIPVLAHPMSLYLSWSKLYEALKDYHERGIMGLEAFHPGARMTECLRLEEMAAELGYFVTAGSDFHGEKIRLDRKLGHTVDGRKIDDKFYYENLLPALEKNRLEHADN